MGLVLLVVSLVLFPFPDPTIWLLFAGLYVILELFAVEVNDRLVMSSSTMVMLTAGVIFALDPQGSATAGMALMAALGPFVIDDFKQRRWFQPVANFGQQITVSVAAGLILDLGLGRVGEPSVQTLFLISLFAAVASLTMTAVQTALVRKAVQTVYPYDRLEPWSHLGTLFAAQFVMGLLGGLIGGAYVIVKRPAVLVLVIGVYGIGHLSVYAFSQLRISHLSAIKGFVKTLEAKDMYTRGHTERVAYFAEMIGEEYGFSGTQIEEIKWAALIHDLGKLAVPTELIRKRGRLDDSEYGQMKEHAHLVEEILAEVDFLQPMVEIASGHHSHYDGNGYGGRGHTEGRLHRRRRRRIRRDDVGEVVSNGPVPAIRARRVEEALGSPIPPRGGRCFRARLGEVGETMGGTSCQRRGDGPSSRRRAGVDSAWLTGIPGFSRPPPGCSPSSPFSSACLPGSAPMAPPSTSWWPRRLS